MVGVPSSKGCPTCLRRAVKCDETRPACGQCRRGGRECPGYSRPMIFIDEAPKLARKHKSKADRSGSRKTVSRSLRKAVSLQTLPDTANLERFQMLSVCVSTMFPKAPMRTSYMGSWLWHLLPRLGHSRALDRAFLSLALSFFSSNDPLLSCYAQQAYGRALCSLQAALGDPAAAFSAETLAATLLLTYYESVASVDHAWVCHAGGAGRLLQLRGPRRCYDSPFEYLMFLACRGSIISEALLTGTSSFLESPEWQSVPVDVVEYPMLPSPVELSHQFFVLAASLPRVLHTKLAPACDRLLPLSEASSLRSRFTLWFQEYISFENRARQPVLISAPALFPKGTFDEVFLYYDTASATMIVTYYAYLILLNKHVAQYAGGGDTEDKHNSASKENMELARWICMSVYYCAWLAGVCGTSTLKMVLPIARGALPSEYHSWVDRWS